MVFTAGSALLDAVVLSCSGRDLWLPDYPGCPENNGCVGKYSVSGFKKTSERWLP